MKRHDSVPPRSTVKTGPYYTHGGAGPKDMTGGRDLSRDATNVIEKPGHNPPPVGPTAIAAKQNK